MKPESTEDHRVWHSGPPPWIGWVNASIVKSPSVWRWHYGNGHYSESADNEDFAALAGKTAKSKNTSWHPIFWSDYWPEDGRVTREQARGMM